MDDLYGLSNENFELLMRLTEKFQSLELPKFGAFVLHRGSEKAQCACGNDGCKLPCGCSKCVTCLEGQQLNRCCGKILLPGLEEALKIPKLV